MIADDGAELHVEIDDEAGSEATLIFVNGLNLSIGDWQAQRAALGDIGRLVLYDHRGHGRSAPTWWREASIARAARDLGQVIDHITANGPVVLVGHSLGGALVAALAAERPDLFGQVVAGVVLVEALPAQWGEVCFGLPPAAARLLMAVARRITRFVRKDVPVARLTKARRRRVMSTSARIYLAYGAALLAADHRATYRALARVDTLLIAGTGDPYASDEHKAAVAHQIPRARLVVAEGGGHSSHRRSADLVNSAIRELVSRMRPPKAAPRPKA